LLIGDETALPAIARRLEELPAEARVIALVETSDPADRRELFTRAHLQMTWLPKPAAGASNGLAAATERLAMPAGEGYAWAAGEASAIAAVRRVLTGPLGLDKDHVRAAAYWKHGAVAHHETL
jgi:NADPH-dependent ferric siderophore reductase